MFVFCGCCGCLKPVAVTPHDCHIEQVENGKMFILKTNFTGRVCPGVRSSCPSSIILKTLSVITRDSINSFLRLLRWTPSPGCTRIWECKRMPPWAVALRTNWTCCSPDLRRSRMRIALTSAAPTKCGQNWIDEIETRTRGQLCAENTSSKPYSETDSDSEPFMPYEPYSNYQEAVFTHTRIAHWINAEADGPR